MGSIEVNLPTDKGLVIKEASGQSANALEVQNNLGAVLFYIDKDGNISSGGGDVYTSATPVTDNAIPRYDGTLGAAIQNSVVTIDDTTGTVKINTHTAITDPGAGATGTKVLNDLGQWVVGGGGAGDVVGPAGATDNAIARYDSTTGKLLQNSLASVDDNGSVNIPTGQSYKINNVALSAADVGAAASGTGVTNGDSHDHSGGDGAQINHTTLSNIGTNSHSDIDTAVSNSASHISAASPHSGHAIGIASTTDNRVTRFDSTGGKQLQDSLMTIDDSGSPNIPTGQTYNINGSAHSHTLANHALTNSVHAETGLTSGHLLKATGTTTFGFSAGAPGDVALGNVTNNAQVKKIGSSTDNQVVRWDGTTGDTPQGSLMTIDDSGSPNIPTGQTYKINGSSHTHTPTEAGLSNVDNYKAVRDPGSSVDEQVVRWDGTGGDTVQACLLTVNDAGTVNIPSGQTYNINGSAHTHGVGTGGTGTNTWTQGNIPYSSSGTTNALTAIPNPDSTTKFLKCGNATPGAVAYEWATPSGTGDVVGPGSATDNALPRFDTTTGKLIQNSVITVADTTGAVSINGHQALTDPTASPTNKFLRDDGTWQTPTASATFTGPFDYYVYKVSSTYYARNEQTGADDYSNADFATLMASVLAAKTGCSVQLAASTSFSVPAGGLQIYDSANNGVHLVGANEYTTILVATGSCTTGVVDVRAQNVVVENLTIDGGAQTSTVGLSVGSQGDETRVAYHCSFHNLIVQNCPTAGIQIWDDVNYCTFESILDMFDHAGYGVEFRGDAYSNYNSGQVNFINCIISGPLGAVRRSWTAGGTMKGVAFFGCDFQDGHSGTYQVDCTGIYNLLFDRCIFETSVSGKAGTSQIRLDSYGVTFNCCSFAHRSLGTQTFVTNGTSYASALNAGYTFINPKIYSSVAGDTTFNISGGTIIGTSRESVSGTVYSSTTLANCTIIDPNHTYEFLGSGNANFQGSVYINGHQAITDPTASPTNKFLRDDGTWQTPTGSGDVVGPSSATDNALPRFDSATGKLIQDSVITVADTTGALSINGHQAITDPTASPTNKFLRDDGTWQTVTVGSGDVVGPGSATDNAIARFDNTTGKLIQNSAVTVADTTGDIVPGADNTGSLGSATNGWGRLYLGAATTYKIHSGGTVVFRTMDDTGYRGINANSLTIAAGSSGFDSSGNCIAYGVNVGTGAVFPGTDLNASVGKSTNRFPHIYMGHATAPTIRSDTEFRFRNIADSAYQLIDILSLKIGGTSICDSSRNLSNIGTVGCGQINTTSTLQINSHNAISDPGTPSGKFLRDDSTWQTVTGGSGDVVGPAGATDNAICRFDTATGKLIQDSVVTIADTTGNMSGVGTLGCGAITSSGALGLGANTITCGGITHSGDIVPSADNVRSLGDATHGLLNIYMSATGASKIRGTSSISFRNIGDTVGIPIYCTTVNCTGMSYTGGATASHAGSIDPTADATYNLGTSTNGWARLYLGSATTAKIQAGTTIAHRNMADSADQAITTAGITHSGDIVPSTDNTRSLGSATYGYAKIYMPNSASGKILCGATPSFRNNGDTADANVSMANLVLSGSKVLTASTLQVRNSGDTAYQAVDALSLSIGGSAVINSSGVVTNQVVGLNFVIDGGGATITTGKKGHLVVPFAMTITGWDIIANASGSIVVDVNRSTYSGFPTTSSIAGSELPTLSSVQKNQDLSLSTWTTSIAAGDVLEFEVDSATTVQRVTVAIRGTRA